MEMVNREIFDKYPAIYSSKGIAEVKRQMDKIKSDMKDMGFGIDYVVSTLLATADGTIFPVSEINLKWDPGVMESPMSVEDYHKYKSSAYGQAKTTVPRYRDRHLRCKMVITAAVAQWVEQVTLNHLVAGSNPAGGTIRRLT